MVTRLALVALVVSLAVAGCGKRRVATQPDMPPLAPPPPPARVVAPPETQEEPQTPPPEQPERKPVRRVAPRNEAPPPKVESPKPQPPQPVAPPPVEAQPPATTLQTAKPSQQAETEHTVQTLILQASRDLDRVDYRRLSADGKGQYNTARRFVEQARQALKEKNFVLAQRLAEKAATIAGVLATG